MERRIRVRIGAFVALIALILGLYTLRVYKLQTAMTEEEIELADSLTYRTTVSASRGQVLDRNGTVLVGNRASYNLIIINFVLFNGPSPNESLLNLIHTCDELGIELKHHLPISETRPYEYTLDDLGATWSNYFRRFLNFRSMDSDISAATFMDNLREDYKLPEDLSPEDAYRLIAIRFELDLRNIENMPLDNYVVAEDVDAAQLAAIIELDIPGVIVDISTVREYNTMYASHLLGHTTKMSAEQYNEIYKERGYPMNAVVGADGVELAFEEYLHGQDGLMETTVTSTGEILEQKYLSTPVPGGNVELTIDIGIQETAYQALEDWILYLREKGVTDNQYGMDAKGGAVVVQKVNTGEVLASVSYPGYDPETFNLMYNELAADEVYKPLLDRCRFLPYPPGSIYKMISAITAIEYGDVSRWREVYDVGAYTKFKDQGYVPACHIYRSRGYGHGDVNMMEALKVSCNYYFYEVSPLMSIADLDFVASKFGLGESTGSELPEYIGQRANEETKAKAFAGTDNESWVVGDMLQAVIGQSVNEFTPLQMCVYTSTLATEGVRYEATYLRRVVSWDFQELLLESEPTIADTITLSDETKTMLREGMTMAAGIDGTASAFMNYPVSVAAKTGTAQHGSGLESDNASLVCYAPADDPEIAIAIYVENGGQGGQLANIAMEIMDAYFSQTGKYETVHGENEIR